MSDKTVRPYADMQYEMMTYVSHGGMPLIVDTPEDDGNTLDPVAYERFTGLFKEVREKESAFGHEPLRQVGLYFSAKTRDWYGRDDPQRYFQPFVGAHRILVESHIPVGFVFDEDVAIERLRQFPLVYLANTAILSAAEVELFRLYLSEGGKLIATLDTSRFDEEKARPDFALADILGVSFKQKTMFKSNFFRMPPGFASEGFRPDWDIFLYGPNNVVDVNEGTTYGELKLAFHDRGPHTHIGHAPQNSPWKTAGPGLVRRSYGKGEIAYLPFSPEAMYMSDSPLPEHRMVMRNVIKSMLPAPPISVAAPLNVESVITFDRDGNRYIVHFIAFVGVRDAHAAATNQSLVPLMEESWRYRASISCANPVRRATALSSLTEVRHSGNVVTIDTSEVHESVILDL